MATLAEINQTLIRVDENTEDTSRGIGTFVKFLQDNKRKDLEAARESNKVIVPDIQPKVSDTDTGRKSGGLFDGLRNALAGASLASLAPMIGKKLVTRVLGPAAIALFADEIVDFLLPDGFENEAIKEALSGALTGGAIGFAIGGPLGGAIGAGLGALFKNEKFKNSIKELSETLKEQGKVLYEKLEPTIINFKNAFVDFFNALGITKEGVTEGLAKFLQVVGDTAAEGVKQLTRLIKGDIDTESILGGIGTLAAVAALLLPGPFMKLMIGLAALAKGPGKFLLKLAKSPLKFLAPALGIFGLGSLAADANVDVDDGKGKQRPKPGSVVRSAKGNLMIAGPDGKATATKAPPGSKVGDIPKGTTAPGKFGRMLKFLRLPGIATLLAGYDIYSILNSDSSRGEKVKALTEVFGGVLGGVAGLKAGALVGGALGTLGFPLVGTGIGGVLGAGLGYFGGKALAGSIAEFLLGGDPKPKMPISPMGDDSATMGKYKPTQTISRPVITSGAAIQDNVNRGRSPGAMGGSNIAFSADTNQTINNTSNTNALISNGPAVDLQDQLVGFGT